MLLIYEVRGELEKWTLPCRHAFLSPCSLPRIRPRGGGGKGSEGIDFIARLIISPCSPPKEEIKKRRGLRMMTSLRRLYSPVLSSLLP
ncbi:hypothetical protein PoB_000274400 [Plakobranchus ocellatus]|uniref:Uncharacterized protein n=1 Tax=Plakobranchus ocellatus TaxID=259542 RepID=A0AAV3Y2J6_9GAST|nr:hypothetical protein PoB_000274400 [Plakobranchus ocellatus]